MIFNKKIQWAVAAVLLIAGAVYITNDRSTAIPEEPPLAEASDEGTTTAESTTPEPSSDSKTTEVANVEVTENGDKESPFAVVETDENTESTDTQASETPTVAESAPVTDDNTAGVPAPGTAIVVPASYPIEDAEKYFIPKDQRGPGNIGGPPPLNFPGGPNDPNLKLPGN